MSAPAWFTVTNASLQNQTNLHSQEIITPTVSGSPQRFYRGRLPVP